VKSFRNLDECINNFLIADFGFPEHLNIESANTQSSSERRTDEMCSQQ